MGVLATSPSLRTLLALVREKQSGELVCRSSLAEVHLHLRQGRIAWGAEATQRPAFMEHLSKSARVQPELLRQVLTRCRSERISLGSALVESGLTTLGGLRCAFSGQIAQAIAQLVRLEDAQHRFSARNYDHYDPRLTFDVRDFIAEDAAASAPQPVDPAALTGQLLLSVEGLLWAEVFDATQWVDAAPPASQPRTPASLLCDSLLDGADFTAVRTTRAALMGFALSPRRSLWCRVSSDATFGSVVSAIATAAALAPAAQEVRPAQGAASWSLGFGFAPVTQTLAAFLARSPDLLAAIVLDADGVHARSGCGAQLAPELCLDLVRRRARCLALPAHAFTAEHERPLDSLCVSAKSMVSGEPGLWCFGAQLLPGDGASLWLFVQRHVSQGLGWAYLSALSRALSQQALEPTG